MAVPSCRVGTAGWAIPKAVGPQFAGDGTHLARYGRRLLAAEINMSFYRFHAQAVYARWAASVPADFRFAVKMPREISHLRKLQDTVEPLSRFLDETAALGEKRGPLLLQLPPGLAYDDAIARAFFDTLRARFDGTVVCEPRHATWFTDDADRMLAEYRVARVLADPARVPRGAAQGGWTGITYRRLHGTPKVYHSAYGADALAEFAAAIIGEARESWCIFDNTAAGHALPNALQLQDRLDVAADFASRAFAWPPGGL